MELTRRLTQLVILRLDELTDELVLEILRENAGYVDAELVPLDELRRSCRDNLERVLQLLGDMVPPGVDPVDAAALTGTRRAERRAPLEAVLRSFRIGGRVVWHALARVAREDGSIGWDDMVDVAAAVWTVVDEVSSAVAGAYRRTELRLRRLDEHRRLTLFTDLLRGRGRDAAFAAEAAAELDLPADVDFLVLAADLRQDTSAEDHLAVHGVRSIWQPHARHTVGLVALDRYDADRVLDLLRTAVRDRVGVSPRVHGLGEVGTAHELAVLALRTLPAGIATTARLDDRLPAALLVRSPDLVDRLVEVVLGPLLRLPDGERQQLLATLSAWLRSNRSPAAAAERLYCHRNTVINRMSKVESLLGRSLEDFENALTVSYALLALDLPEGTHAQRK
ncbi:MAG: PucR family transcriptional regulator [Actinophytocola sp.]|uniref:PucR family transcriptional regulator n=1 Tax=Actinophytocola sp. TaxID=1872138 RepID=UPI003D6B5B76